MLRRLTGEMVCSGTSACLRLLGRNPEQVFGAPIRSGPDGTSVALTFDDGPSESTPQLLELLARYKVTATFFQCGANVLRLPDVARSVVAAGHELGNHTFSHPQLHFRNYAFIRDELSRTQQAISDVTSIEPQWFRPPLGLRWFGLRAAEQSLCLRRVLWTHGGNDWHDGADQIVSACTSALHGGAILCLHDGRNLEIAPRVENTLRAVKRIVPMIQDKGFSFVPLRNLLVP